jgi:hypothetical protein
MIKNVAEVRVAVLAILGAVLALNGFVGCALVVLAVLLPWRPLLLVGSYLAQPVVDWHLRKTRKRRETGFVQIERELDTFLGGATKKVTTPPPSPAGELEASLTQCQNTILQPMAVANPHEPPFETLPPATPSISALAVSSVIEDYLRKFPQDVFDNMNLEVERVNFSGENAEAFVKFKSPHVKELAISQRYILRKSGGQWEVESRQPRHGSSKASHYSIPTLGPPAAAPIGTA